ncbi:MAG: damage-inducible protein DinB [Hyphobacterium sp.]|nr:MAG: damage-inducible protein DinB [Hyphobacterium sp.]
MRDHFERLAAYNVWANARVYSAANALPDAALMENVGGFFGSLFGTLTHILIADRIWMHRLTGEGLTHTDLEDRPFKTLAELAAARQQMDHRIAGFIAALAETEFSTDLHYKDMSGQPHAVPRNLVLTHFFNHQTHHRGQAHHMLTVAGLDAPPLDFMHFVLDGA